MKQVEIPESCIETFKKEVENLQKKAKKLNINPPEYKITGHKWVELPKEKDDDEVSMGKVFTVEFDDVNVVLNGWKIICRIQKNDGNLVGVKNINNAFYYPYEENIPQACYEKSPSLCEHCGRNISTRKTTYILRNVTTNEYKQVGSSCVHDFVSSTNNIDSVLNWVSSFTDYIREKSISSFENVPMDRYYPTKMFLSSLVKLYAEAGFIPTIPPTGNASYKYPTYYEYSGKFLRENYSFDENINAEIEKILEYHRKKFDELGLKESLDKDENRERNASSAVLAAYMRDNDGEYLNMFMYGVRLYYKNFTKELYVTNNEFLGNVGEIISVRAKLMDASKRSGNFGEYYLVHFLTSEGYKLTAFVSLNHKFAEYLERVHVGCEMTFEAKVKSHDEYKGDNSTKINYIKNFKLYYPDQKVELGVSS